MRTEIGYPPGLMTSSDVLLFSKGEVYDDGRRVCLCEHAHPFKEDFLMTSEDIRAAVLRHFLQPSKTHHSLLQEHGLIPKISTLQLARNRRIPQGALQTVLYESQTGRPVFGILLLQQQADASWLVSDLLIKPEQTMRDKQEGPPQVDFVSNRLFHSGSVFWTGGQIRSSRVEVTSVRLVDFDESIIEDVVQQNTVLFFTDQSLRDPITVELYDRRGERIGRQLLI